jgi:ribonuclease HI
MQQIWKCDSIPPRIQVFGWRLIRGAILTGVKGAARSNHINHKCTRCGQKEDDFHLFFDCRFSHAVWFASTLGLRVQGLVQLGINQVQDTMHYILSNYNSDDALPKTLTILWSIWKARNDLLFNRKNLSPMQVLYMAKALQVEKDIQTNAGSKHYVVAGEMNSRRSSLEPDLNRVTKGPNIYTDGAWKCKPTPIFAGSTNKEKAGLGIYIHWEGPDQHTILVQASTTSTSALQAEAHAMELAAYISNHLDIDEPNFLTDSQILADVARRRDPRNHPGHWTIRPNLMEFIYHTQGRDARVFKIKRENNSTAHKEAHDALNSKS